MQSLTIQSVDGTSFQCPVPDFSQNCSVLYNAAAQHFGFARDSILLTYAGKTLEQNQSMLSFGLRKGTTVTAVGTVPGGCF